MNAGELDFTHLESDADFDKACSNRPAANTKKFPCEHCAGTGKYRGARVHQPKAHCFACGGKGYFKTSSHDRKKARVSSKLRSDKKAADMAEQFKANFPAEQEFLAANNWSDFYRSLLGAGEKYGSLSAGQLGALHSAMAKAADREEAKAKALANPDAVIDLTAITERIETAKGNGLKKPRLNFEGCAISEAPAHGKNAGHYYVKDGDGEYAGKITPEGKYYATRFAPEGLGALLTEVAKDPYAAAIRFGRATGKCCCCNRLLTDPNSIAAGIGPICESKFF